MFKTILTFAAVATLAATAIAPAHAGWTNGISLNGAGLNGTALNGGGSNGVATGGASFSVEAIELSAATR